MFRDLMLTFGSMSRPSTILIPHPSTLPVDWGPMLSKYFRIF